MEGKKSRRPVTGRESKVKVEVSDGNSGGVKKKEEDEKNKEKEEDEEEEEKEVGERSSIGGGGSITRSGREAGPPLLFFSASPRLVSLNPEEVKWTCLGVKDKPNSSSSVCVVFPAIYTDARRTVQEKPNRDIGGGRS
ncbi:hypothetical protein M0804_008927 [Polistes exclamans]|nr:hypothetical protein M0804_008927 [Polistes exclamans]